MRPRRFLTAAFSMLAAGCCLLPAIGCASVNAGSASDAPLAMPPPPPRLEPIEPEPPPSPPPAAPVEDARPPTSARKPANPPARPDSNKPEPNRQEPSKPEPPPPADSHKPVEEPARPAPTLQTTPAGAEGELERTIRGILQRARGDLNRVDYKKLNAEARTQYDTAKRFVTQAEDALRAKNLVFAKTVADKAAGLAAQLAGK